MIMLKRWGETETDIKLGEKHKIEIDGNAFHTET